MTKEDKEIIEAIRSLPEDEFMAIIKNVCKNENHNKHGSSQEE